MLVTVVTPVTGNPLMRQAIESVQNQTYPNIEHLIVIDGEEREAKAKAILSEIEVKKPSTHILTLPFSTGKNRFNGHRIYGMSPFITNGEFICYLDEDNWYDPLHVESLVKLVLEKDLDWAYSLRKIVDPHGNFVCLDDGQSIGKWRWGLKNEYNLVDVSSFFIKKSLALRFAEVWYVKYKDIVIVDGLEYSSTPDQSLTTLLLQQNLRVDTSGIYSMNYRLGGSEMSGAKDFFYEHNQIKQEQYPKGFPWRKTKLRDIPLPLCIVGTSNIDLDCNTSFPRDVKNLAQKSAKAVLPYLWQILDHRITSVVDVGCGKGSWLAQISNLFDLTDILGIDAHCLQSTELEIPLDKFHAHDLTEPLSINRRFDLVMSLEVAQHLAPHTADSFVNTLIKLGDIILFSAAIPLQGGVNYNNAQFPDYWVKLFAKNNYKCLDCLRGQFWNDDQVEWWYAQNMLLFVKEELLNVNKKLFLLHQKTDLERLARIHPFNTSSKIAFGHDDTKEIKLITDNTDIIDRNEKKGSFTLHSELLAKFFNTSPYKNFFYHDYSCDLQGWGSREPIFERLITQLSPKLIIEVGTWKGASALHMVDILKAQAIDCPIICVDTWLGGLETVKNNPVVNLGIDIPRRNGYPQLYFQFLANVMHKEADKYIIPLPIESTIASRLMQSWDILADLVYIDGSHEEEDVYSDLVHYWQLVASEGILLIDDYADINFLGVRDAVHRFAKENNLAIHSQENKCWFVKPISPQVRILALTKRIAELELITNPDIDMSYF